MNEVALVDSKVLLRLCQPDVAGRRRAQGLLVRVASEGCVLAVCPQVLYEFWVVATRPISVNGLGLEPAEADAQTDDFLAAFRLLDDAPSSLYVWRRLVRDRAVRGKQAHDARLIAAAVSHGVERFVTLNRADFTRYADLIAIED